jgi:phenylpyruvate tautomerase PptA (4-oxalocrotonate tautomerase family)
VPVIEVKLDNRRVTEESVPKMIETLTQALHESRGASIEHIQ